MKISDLSSLVAKLDPQKRELLLRKMGLSMHQAKPALASKSLQEEIAALPKVAEGEPFAQSPAQQKLWFFERMQPDVGIYNMIVQHRLRGTLNLEALQAAFDALVARHDSLRTQFSEQAGQPLQTVQPAAQRAIEVVDVSQLDTPAQVTRLQQLLAHDGERPFDLAQAPLMRVTVLRLSEYEHEHEQEHVLQTVLHHMVADGWSIGVLYRELAALYQAKLTSSEAQLLPLPFRFCDVLQWQAQPAQQARVQQHIEFWRKALAGTTGLLDLPIDRPRMPQGSVRGARHQFELTSSISEGVQNFARQEGATAFQVMLSSFQILLGRFCGQEDVIVGTPVANRDEAEFAPLVGMMINTLALRADLSGEPSFRQMLARSKSHFLDAMSHSSAPLEKVVDALAVERVPGRAPLVQAMFVLAVGDEDAISFPGLTTQYLDGGTNTVRFEITLSVGLNSRVICCVLDYNADLFDASSMARLAESFGVLLQAALREPDCAITRLPLLSDAAQQALLALGSGGPRCAAIAGCQHDALHELLPLALQEYPEQIAIIDGELSLTYRMLANQVARLAQQLQAHEIGVEQRVALLADRSAESLIGLLAILAVGAAYVPLDPSYPDERAAFVLHDAEIRAIVCPPALRTRAAQLAGMTAFALPICEVVSATSTTSAASHCQLPSSPARADNTAYVIYTSGSTGNPKGVVLAHSQVMNLVQGFVASHDFVGQRILMIPPLVFDASVGDIFPAIATGATLVLHRAPNELGARELLNFCAQHQVSAIDAPAALWRRWTEALLALNLPGEVLPGLRLMMFGGEAVPMEQVQRFARLTKQRVTLANHYGPTEAAVCACMLSTRDGAELSGAELPIGRPLPGVSIYLLDEQQQLAPQGVVAQLCIAGAGVAQGYLHQPELNAKHFVLDPFSSASLDHPAKMYCTGDLARWNNDGTLHFIGRRDNQVKLRGFRIELGEIETALAACPGVRGAVAAVCEIRPGDKRLVAYFVADSAVDAQVLRAWLAARLPDAMLPAIYQRLEALPLTGNGKIDRRALPAVDADAASAASPARQILAPNTDTERRMLVLWSELLGRSDLSIDDEFFSVGGDSLLCLPLVFKLQQAFGVEVPIVTIFSAPSILQLSKAIDDLQRGIQIATTDITRKVVLPMEINPRSTDPARAPRHAPQSVLITGATGFLGAYLLRELLDTCEAEMLCLVRAPNYADGVQRIIANLRNYALWPTDQAIAESYSARIVPLLGDLALPQFGLRDEDFAALAESADVIFHNGGQVNFIAPYENMEAANVFGTREVLRLACTNHVKPVHFVSTLGVYFNEDYLTSTVREDSVPPSGKSQQGGYNQSKWVAEQLCLVARERGLPVAIYRPARITGDSRTGIGNLGDFFNSWFKGCAQLGMLPYVEEDSFDMAPVDYVGRAIVAFALGAADANGNFHFFNPVRLSISAASEALEQRGIHLRKASYLEWRAALQNAAAQGLDNAMATFATLYPEVPDSREPSFDCHATEQAAAAIGLHCPAGDSALFMRYLDYMIARKFLLPQTKQETA